MSTPADRWSVHLDGATLLDRYVVERMVGGGGMANVYLARDEQLEIPVVVKVPHAAFLAERGFRERFERETRDLVALQHPHIVRILARGEHEGLPFLVMQFLEGGSFGDRMRAQKGAPMPWSAIEGWFPGVARALDFIHDKGIVHRDIKPDNLLFDEHGHGYLSDFGIAKAVGGADTGLTVTGATPGSPAYMAPEQPRTSSLTGSSDQYSLAATLYEALAGRPVFEGETAVDVLIKKQTEKPRHLAELLPDLARPVADAIMRGLERRPDDRFATCGAMVEAMTAAPVATPAPAPAPKVPAVRAASPPTPADPPPVPPEGPARTASTGTTVTLGGGTKAMWIVFAVLMLGGPAVMLLARGGDEADRGIAPESAEMADVPLPPKDEDPGIPPAMGAKEGKGPAEHALAERTDTWTAQVLAGNYRLDADALRARLRSLQPPRAGKRKGVRPPAGMRELARLATSGFALTLRDDGTYEVRMRPKDEKARTVRGTWRVADRLLEFKPDPRPDGARTPVDSFRARPEKGGLVLIFRGHEVPLARR